MVAETLAAHISEFSPAENGSLFTTTSGHLYRQEHFGARVFKPAAKSAGLPAGVTSHDLRHHYASVLLAAGESVVAVAERLGHENATLVLKTYGHLMPDVKTGRDGPATPRGRVTAQRRPKPLADRCSS